MGHATHVAETLEQPLLLPKDMDALRKIRQQDLFMSLKRDLALVSILFDIFLLDIIIFFSFLFFFFLLTYNCYVVLVQITQKIFVAEEWVKQAWNDVKNEAYLRFKAEKALGAMKEENKYFLSKLTVEERERKSAQVGLKNAET